MILEHLELERVRRFTPRFECTFAPGLNAVLGPNESGKSTIFEALMAALFFDPKSTRSEVRSLYSWSEDRPFALRLVFREGENSYDLWKDFHAREISLEERPSGKVWRDSQTAQRRLEELLGLAGHELFSASAAVAQGRLVVPDKGRGRKDLEEALEEAMTGGGDGGGAARAIELLGKDIDRLSVGLKDKAYKTPGPIKAAEERLAGLHDRHHELRASFAQRVSHRQSLKSAEEELEEVSRALGLKQSLLEAETERREIEASLEAHRKRYDEIDSRYRALEENTSRRGSAEESLKALGPLADLEEGEIEALKAALARKESLHRPLEEARRGLEGAAVPAPWGAWVLGVLGFALPVAAGFVGSYVWLRTSSAILGALALIAAGWLWYRRKAALRLLGERRTEARRSEAELEEVEARVQELVERMGGQEPEAVIREAKEAGRLSDELEKLQSERRGLLGGQAAESLTAERAELLRSMAVGEERLKEERFSAPPLEAERFFELRSEADSLAERRGELTRRVENLRGMLHGADDEAEELAALEEAIEASERELKRHRQRLRVRELAKEALEEAQRAVIAPAAERYQAVLGRYAGALSQGRYQEVRLKEGLLGFDVLGPEREGFVEPKELSFGTAEQLLLAARLTLTELVAGEKKPPLLLDEPFGSYDEGRLKAAVGLLSSIAKERQVVLFTHQEAVASACENVIRLPSP